MSTLPIGVLASGRGSNFQAIIDAIDVGYLSAEIRLLVTDNPSAYALQRASEHKIESIVMVPKQFPSKDAYYTAVAGELNKRGVELVVLAGFMRVVGKPLIDQYRNRIMNIHPALLPSFPGLHGQKQALDYGVKVTGCTVHFVDEGMDTGPVIIQAAVPVEDGDTEDTLSARILSYEHKIFPEAIRLFCEGRISVEGRKTEIAGQKDSGKEGMVVPPLRS